MLCHGELLGVVPKKYLPNYNEFYELRHFTPGKEAVTTTEFFGKEVPFGMNLLFQCEKMPRLKVAAELCEDLWTPNPPSVAHALAGATVVVNLSASDEMVGKDSYRRSLVSAQSARLICGYIYATAGEGESTTDLVFGGQHLIAENGTILAEAKRFENQIICADLDVDRLTSERRRMTTYPEQRTDGYQIVRFSLAIEETKLTRYFDPRPFVPSDKHNRDQRCDEILNIQAMGLKKRLAHTHCQSAVIGISGGLDSTLALLVTARAFDLLGIPRKQILSVTMPCFGTTDRTYQNACELTRCLGATLKEIDIKEAVNLHFRDIGQNPEKHDVTYENGQARERTQILMDLANQSGGMVIGLVIFPSWHLAGQRTMATICRCMPSMRPYRKPWCAIWCSIMRTPAGKKHFPISFWMCSTRRSARNSCRRKMVSFLRKQKISSDRTNSTISFCTICCV